MPTAKSQLLSVALHCAALAILLLAASHSILSPPLVSRPSHSVQIAPWRPLRMNRDNQQSGGSNQTLLPARHGAPPPRALKTFIPPSSVPDPKLPMAIAVAFDSPTLEIDTANIGDPLSHLRVGEFGRNGRGGIGDHGCCGGIGNNDHGPPGMSSGGRHSVTPPQLLYKVDPEFSEEARKAKFSGVVILAIEVDANGRATSFRVLQGPGLGLEQKAIEAVKQWRFRPGLQDGKAIVTSATVQVNFRLL